jgi:hypothetical protein
MEMNPLDKFFLLLARPSESNPQLSIDLFEMARPMVHATGIRKGSKKLINEVGSANLD